MHEPLQPPTTFRPTRRHFLKIGALTAASLAGLRATGVAGAGASAATSTEPVDDVVAWIDANASALSGTDPAGPLDDLAAVEAIVGDALVVGLGESAHGTHTQLQLKHRVIRYLVEELGFRTVAREESWGSGVLLDRYVTDGTGDARELVGSAMFMLQTEAMLELVEWMRTFNADRPADDKVRFLGADVMELRQVLFDEVTEFVTDTAPVRLPELHEQLEPIAMQGSPGEHLGWYFQLADQERADVVAHAVAVVTLVESLPDSSSAVERSDAVQHARAIAGFYETYDPSRDAEDVRDGYISEILGDWQQRTGHRIAYSAANAHTAAIPEMLVSAFPPDEPVVRHLAGGLLKRELGDDYVSIATSFHEGEILAGWETGAPSVFTVPAPSAALVDNVLGQAELGDYVIDLRAEAPAAVRGWLDSAAVMRMIGAAYDAAIDEDYSITVDPFRGAFDAIFHLGRVEASRPLEPAASG